MISADFPSFYKDIHGYEPFPWQRRLAERLLVQGWPEVLDLPTAAGKTSAIDVAVWALAMQADLPLDQRTAPRRIFFVIDRRIVVDEAYDHSLKIARALANPQTPAVRAIAVALRQLGGGHDGALGEQLGDAPPLAVARLRGGMYRNDTWARCPDQPLVCISTVDQVGSRLLFRGYGLSPYQRPIHAGLVGNDALFLVDEAHLSGPFLETFQALQRFRQPGGGPALTPLRLVQMSATVDAAKDVHKIDAEDQAHPVLKQRLEASKMATLEDTDSLEQRAAELALAFAEKVKVVGVVVNRVAAARKIQQLLSKELAKRGLEGRALLLTGRIRPADRDRLLKDWKAQISADREGDPEKPLVLVATQTVEVGANLSFDALITEAAPLDALRQRFGRLDRKGKNIHSEAYILCRKNQKEDPVYGSSLEDTWKWLNKVATQEKKGPKRVDFGISALQPLLTDDIRPMLAPRAEAPVLLKSHMNAWLQTAPAPAVDPDVAPFLHGEGGKVAADVQLVWRADLPETLDEIQDQLSALPPMQRESLAVPIWAVLAWLTGQEADPSDLEGVEGIELRRGRAKAELLRWSSEGAEVVELDDQRPGDTKIRPGDTLVFSAKQGGCDAFGWNPTSTEPVTDLADEVQLSRPDLPQYSLRLRWDLLQKHLTGEEDAMEATRRAILALAAVDQEEGDGEEAFDTFLKCITKVSFEEEFSWWHSCLSQRALAEGGRDRRRSLSVVGRGDRLRLVLRPSKQERAALLTLLDPEAPVGVVRTVVRASGVKLHEEDSDFSDDDERALLTGQVTLADHSGGVQGWARTFATRCGLGADLIRDLAFAGWLHDVGKADRRMQALFYGGSLLNFGGAEDTLLAKSGINPADPKARDRAFRLSNYPRGMRHEVLSVAMLQGNPELLARAVDKDLLQHLVGTHHGRGRPLPPPQPDPSPRLVHFQHGQDHLSARSDHGLDRWGSGWVDRFWALNERYGPWALAYLEAILRLADHRRSEWEERNLREVNHV